MINTTSFASVRRYTRRAPYAALDLMRVACSLLSACVSLLKRASSQLSWRLRHPSLCSSQTRRMLRSLTSSVRHLVRLRSVSPGLAFMSGASDLDMGASSLPTPNPTLSPTFAYYRMLAFGVYMSLSTFGVGGSVGSGSEVMVVRLGGKRECVTTTYLFSRVAGWPYTPDSASTGKLRDARRSGLCDPFRAHAAILELYSGL